MHANHCATPLLRLQLLGRPFAAATRCVGRQLQRNLHCVAGRSGAASLRLELGSAHARSRTWITSTGGLHDAATVHYVRVESCSFGVRCVVGARILIGFLLNYDGNLLFSFSEGRLISVTRVLSQCDLPKIMCMVDARVDNISARVFWCVHNLLRLLLRSLTA